MTANNIRWCKCGDTISTARPLSDMAGSHANHHIHAICETPESCAYANDLIAAGRWRVSICGQCKNKVEECGCKQ